MFYYADQESSNTSDKKTAKGRGKSKASEKEERRCSKEHGRTTANENALVDISNVADVLAEAKVRRISLELSIYTQSVIFPCLFRVIWEILQ